MTQKALELLDRQQVLSHPDLRVDITAGSLPAAQPKTEWPLPRTQDYVLAFVLNEDGQALIVEGYRPNLERISWQVLGGPLPSGEEPIEGVARMLVQITGYQANSWRHLTSLVTDGDHRAGVGHFFLGRNAIRVAQPSIIPTLPYEVKWIRLGELKRALWDGRISGTSYATAVALGLLAVGYY